MSGEVTVSRELLERLADHAAALSHSDTTQEQRDAARQDAEEADNALSLAALAALTPPAPASADTWEAVSAVAKEANTMPPFVGRWELPERESDARYELIDSARDYGYALKLATRIPQLREKYHRDLVEFRAALNPEATP